jgi:hypothetical protein
MNHGEIRAPGKVPTRTIVAAIAMLLGIVLIGYGYYREQHVMLYVGLVVTLGGVMTEAILRLTRGPTGRHREKITGA